MTRSSWLYPVAAFLLVTACTGGAGSTTTPGAPQSTTILGSTTSGATQGQAVQVFFGVEGSADCAEVLSFAREIPSSRDPVEGAFEALLAGPTESEPGATSWFSAATADALLSANLVGGLLTVDLADLSSTISGASSSCGSSAFLAQLQATGFQFEEVEEIVFQFEGSCETFFGFLQMECTTVPRPG